MAVVKADIPVMGHIGLTPQSINRFGGFRVQREEEKLLEDAPPGRFTLEWLLDRLHERSFGIIMLVLALLATSPLGSVVPGLVLLILSLQMIAGRQNHGDLPRPQSLPLNNQMSEHCRPAPRQQHFRLSHARRSAGGEDDHAETECCPFDTIALRVHRHRPGG